MPRALMPAWWLVACGAGTVDSTVTVDVFVVMPVDQIAPYLLKREELGSTGIGRGVAIPHARLPDLQQPHGLLAKLKQPIEFDAIDGQAVDIVFVLLLPAAVENAQLSALALVARTLRPPENLARLRSAKNSSELYSAIA